MKTKFGQRNEQCFHARHSRRRSGLLGWNRFESCRFIVYASRCTNDRMELKLYSKDDAVYSSFSPFNCCPFSSSLSCTLSPKLEFQCIIFSLSVQVVLLLTLNSRINARLMPLLFCPSW
ncbi:hypothetical protein Tcan_14148 [Toxocara canis]|uniref:Uncharacterized protein n=1 Tax=Toxocara canis TaxID=6265 RepID=A0A0B2V036_TOXCA|nr:hypothetical protein Tcan_14148 [Toxocara canis]